jgi:tetratricopeptide (TPR) repeat protein
MFPPAAPAKSRMTWRSIAGLALAAALAHGGHVWAQTPAAAPDAATAGTPPAAPAAPPPAADAAPDAAQITIPPDLSEPARRTYNQSLKEATELVAKKSYPAALAKLDALIAQRPREPQARFQKGVVQSETGQTDAAILTFRTLTEDYPELPEPHNNLAVLYAQKGEYVLARSELETAIQTAPDWPVAHENLGDIFTRLAAAEYARAQTLDKGNKSAPAKLALAKQILVPAPPAAKPSP